MPKLKNFPMYIKDGKNILTFVSEATVAGTKEQKGIYWCDSQYFSYPKDKAIELRIPESKLPENFIEG